MRLYKLTSFILLSWLTTGWVAAAEMTVAVKLANIRVEKTVEKGRDDVYFNITYYSSLGQSDESRVPAYPAHWLSTQLDKVKNVVLWQGSIPEGESVKLVISLGEQERAGWEVDSLIGAAELNLHNKKGRLEKKWTVPVFEEKKEVEMLKESSPEHYVFKGAGSRYDVAFRVEKL